MNTKFIKAAMVIASAVLFFSICAGQADDDPKSKALTILENKCNVCHSTQNPGKVFTHDNMERFAPKIYRQVFVKKRMPRGNEVTLSNDDRQALTAWLKSLNIPRAD